MSPNIFSLNTKYFPRQLDYVGISLLTVGSFVPWLYYSFYCDFVPKLIYMTFISVLGVSTIIITMMDRFTTAAYR